MANSHIDVVISGGAGGHVQPATTLPKVHTLQAHLSLIGQLILLIVAEVVHRGEEPGMQFNSIETVSHRLLVRFFGSAFNIVILKHVKKSGHRDRAKEF